MDYLNESTRSGPLAGVRVVEIAGIGPGPLAGMLLADMGADVVRVDRRGGSAFTPPELDVLNRGKRSIEVDLKDPHDVELVLRLAEQAELMFEGFRPGVAERLGIGPDDCLARNPSLVYGRITGWGQTGPLANKAGHDITYLAPTGLLGAIGPSDGPPVIPLNLVGDFGGGTMYLVVGLLAGLVNARRTGAGQVVDAAIVDGAAHLGTIIYSFLNSHQWQDHRGTNHLDGAAPYYAIYATSDGRYMAVGAIEPQFYAALLLGLGLDPGDFSQEDRSAWPTHREAFARAFAARAQEDWSHVFGALDACVEPVLGLREAAEHPHLRERGTFVEEFGIIQPAPAPRFSRTPAVIGGPPALPGKCEASILKDWGIAPRG